MKTKKWLWITLISILTLIVLAGVGLAGYRVGLTQNPAVIKQLAELRAQRAEQFQRQNPGQLPQWNDKAADPRDHFNQRYDPRIQSNRRFDRGRDFAERGRFSPLLGLLHLIILGALFWFGYKWIKNSGWKLVRETQLAPIESEAADVADKKSSE